MTLKIALLGFGTVASGVPLILEQNSEKINQLTQKSISISKILVRDEQEKSRLMALGHNYHFVTDIEEILADEEISVVVELIGRIEPAKTFITKALESKKHVVSANKDLIALHDKELLAIARQNKVSFYYEAAVAGGIPILRTLSQSLISDKITRVLGVLNGTSNFMLTKMVEEGWTYEKALQTAQELGYAESDPTNDVEGIDAAYKLVILSQFAFGMTIDYKDVIHQGITSITPQDVTYAQTHGYVIKLVGSIEETKSGLAVEVAPSFLPENHPLARVNDVMNAVYIESIGIGESMYYGPGAGQKPTATSVVADLMTLSNEVATVGEAKLFNNFNRPTKIAKLEDNQSAYYFSIALSSGDKVALTDFLKNEGITVKEFELEKSSNDETLAMISTTSITKQVLQHVQQKLAESSDYQLINAFRILGD
ncbi:homoserine dehydrogenase [Streptococcus pacificus]|uniref:Homoserine dehydrogenase n=1 Tax=Streptococcus pacificus TaxID=2740577 RepID=A0ABS0ZHB1_9STRE|nr:homoserine dehydrogenase [Streptococcus pacificus]MBJ8325385.1 homoserine dehydrogenase [Streptococcus pacificus]